MSYAIGFNQCAELGCHRARMTTATTHGPIHYSRCAAHTALRQTHAFGDVPGASRPCASPSVGSWSSRQTVEPVEAVSTSR